MKTPLYKQARRLLGECVDPFFPVVTEHQIWYNIALNAVLKRRIKERTPKKVTDMLERVADFPEIPDIANMYKTIYIEGYKLDKKREKIRENGKFGAIDKKKIVAEIDRRIYEKSQEAEATGHYLLDKLADRLVIEPITSQKNDFFKVILESVLNTLDNPAKVKQKSSIGKVPDSTKQDEKLVAMEKKIDSLITMVMELKKSQDNVEKVIESLTDIIGD